MRRSIFVLAATTLGALVLASCDDSQSRYRDEQADVSPMEDQAPPVEISEEAVVAPEATDPAVPPADPIPPEERTSEQSVQPESETLFY